MHTHTQHTRTCLFCQIDCILLLDLLAEAEKLISVSTPPDTPPTTPIVSTEVYAEVPKSKIDTTALDLPSELVKLSV